MHNTHQVRNLHFSDQMNGSAEIPNEICAVTHCNEIRSCMVSREREKYAALRGYSNCVFDFVDRCAYELRILMHTIMTVVINILPYSASCSEKPGAFRKNWGREEKTKSG